MKKTEGRMYVIKEEGGNETAKAGARKKA